MASPVGPAASHDLRRGAIGFYGSLFQSISGMGLLLDVGAIFIPVFAVAGEYAPLSVLLGFLFSLLLVNTTYIFSQRYPSSGGYIKFISSVLGRRAGKALGWLYCTYTFAVLPNIAIFLGMIYVPSLIELGYLCEKIYVVLTSRSEKRNPRRTESGAYSPAIANIGMNIAPTSRSRPIPEML